MDERLAEVDGGRKRKMQRPQQDDLMSAAEF